MSQVRIYIPNLILRGVTRRSIHYKTYPSVISLDSKPLFDKSTNGNKLFQVLKANLASNKFRVSSTDSDLSKDINSTVTLPSTHSLITEEKAKINGPAPVARWRRTPTLWFRIIKGQMKVYRESIKGLYRIHKEYKSVSPAQYSSQEMLKNLETASLDGTITRKRYVEMYRRSEFWKLPRFVVMFFIFEELFLVMVYLWPKLGLKSALTVGAYKKITNSHVFSNELRNQMSGTVGIGKNTASISSPYDMDIVMLKNLLQQLPVNDVPNWKISVWKLFNIKPKIANLVSERHEYYVVDDWLLLRSLLDPAVDHLTISDRELVNLIAERQLYNKDEDLNQMVNDDTGRKILIWRMFLYWSFRFDKVDVLLPVPHGTFTNKWGVNNVSILNFPGTLADYGDKVKLFGREHLQYVQ